MNLIEALEALADGKAIRMKGRSDYYYHNLGRYINKYVRGGYAESGLTIHLDHLHDIDDGSLWEEAECPPLTWEEEEYLSTIIAPFRNKATISIEKCRDQKRPTDAFIIITLCYKDGDKKGTIQLPNFPADSMYKGMDFSYPYTLKELEL